MKVTPARIFSAVRRWLIDDARGLGRPVPAEVFDRDYAAGHWDLLFADEETPRNRTVADLIAGVAPHPTVLDIGCGSGRLAQLLAPVGPPARYVGVDLSRAALQRARALGLDGCEFVRGDFETWRPNERFDVVVFNESIGYARDPAATVRRFSDCLISPGGLVISYYRSGNYTAIWRRIAGVAETIRAVVVRNERGAIWDIKLLRQRCRAGNPPDVGRDCRPDVPADKISPDHS
jgi:SAM-dependent methyltransferase